MAKPTSYSLLVYQSASLPTVPKADLKRILKTLLRKARIQVGTYKFVVERITSAPPQSEILQDVYIAKGDLIHRLRVTVQISLKSMDTYSGFLLVPFQAPTEDLVERLSTAAKELSIRSAAPSKLSIQGQQDSSPDVPVHAVHLTDDPNFSPAVDPILGDISRLQESFSEHIRTQRKLLALTPRNSLPGRGKFLRDEINDAVRHLHDLARLRQMHERNKARVTRTVSSKPEVT